MIRLGCGDGGGGECGAGEREGALVGVSADARACSDDISPVFIASQGGHVSCVEALIGAKADVLQCDK
jgi:hypothetical protein